MTEAGWLRPPRLFEPLPLLLCNRGRAFPLANGSIQVCNRRLGVRQPAHPNYLKSRSLALPLLRRETEQ